MKPFLFLLFIILVNFEASAQNIDTELEKEIIKKTLSEYLNTNPNSIASYIKGNKGYENMDFGLKMAIVMEEDSIEKQNLVKDLNHLDFFSDSIVTMLKTKKIKVQITDTIIAYKYKPITKNLQFEEIWNEEYPYLLDDFKYNNLARFDTIIGEEYIELIKKQIHLKKDNLPINSNDLNYSYYEYIGNDTPCDNEFCINADKIYRLVFNKELNKGCYLFSFYCQDNKICRSFIFIRKVNNEWKYVDAYPSWIVDESRGD